MKDKKKLKISLNKVKLSIRNLTKKQKILYVTSFLVVGVITLIFGVYSSFNKGVDNTKLENNVEKKGLSMMLETGRGTGQYEMAIRDKWPTDGYVFNETLSKCENGGTLEWDDVNKTIKTHVTGSDKCYVYFDVEPSDVYIATSNLPTTYGAKGSVACSSNGATYNQKYNEISISNIGKYENCNLTYTEQSSKTYLNDYVLGLAGTTQGNGQVVTETVDIPDYSTSSVIPETSYTNKSMFSSTYWLDTSGNSVNGLYKYSNSKWTNLASAMTSGTYYHFKFTPNESGYYEMCYELSSGSKDNYIYIYVGSIQKYIYGNPNALSASTSTSKTGCVGLGYVSNSSYIKVTQSAGDTIATLSFSINKTESVQTDVNAGTRYEGKNPNNYIWFNNELWRIIGVFDENSHGQSNTNLVKILRLDSIGGLAWDKSRTNNWASASLKNLLNGAYYNAQDGTDSGYCYVTSAVQTNCDYRIKGIQDGYRGMIQNVTWYLGGYFYSTPTAEEFYIYERGTIVYEGNQTSTTGYIGLMYSSDYGYSVLSSSCARTNHLNLYGSSSCGGQSWMLRNHEWLLSHPSTYADLVFIMGAGVGWDNGYEIGDVRPVLYLKSDVYYIDGDGSIENPIIIGE